MQIKSLKPNARNPRRITDNKLNALKKSLAKFGDLSGFVFNKRTGTLVSGHQRQKALPGDSQIKIELKHEKPTEARTVAEGYVLINGERFKYREVDADAQWEMEALLAANKHGGEWDDDLLKLIMADFPALDLEAAGFDIPAPQVSIAAPVFDMLREEKEETDEEYVKNTPQTTEQIPVSSSRNAFQSIEETTDLVNKRFVIIIDCKDLETKENLREKIKVEVSAAGAKFF